MIKTLLTISILQLCQLDLQREKRVTNKQHFEIEQLTRVNSYLQDLSYRKGISFISLDTGLHGVLRNTPSTNELDGL